MGRTVKVPGAARVEWQSVRYAARAQPLDGSDRGDRRMSMFWVRVDLPPTPQMPGATRRALSVVPDGCVGGCGSDWTITSTTIGTATGSTPAEGPVADGSAVRKPER